jgi:hypothetical protein
VELLIIAMINFSFFFLFFFFLFLILVNGSGSRMAVKGPPIHECDEQQGAWSFIGDIDLIN